MEDCPSSLANDCSRLVLPETLPVMVLSECWLFPGCMIPLYIFEGRYREMLKEALRTHRMFCIGTRMESGPDCLLPVSTAGVVNACVQHADGTAHLLLLGTQRVRLREWVGDASYRVARIEPIKREACCPDAVAALRAEVMKRLPPCPPTVSGQMGELCEKLRTTTDCEFVCDVLTYHFVHDAGVLNASLVETCLERRYRLLLESLGG
jgi:ATP-dependent Lon protease